MFDCIDTSMVDLSLTYKRDLFHIPGSEMCKEQIYIHWDVSYLEDKGKLLHYEHLSFCHAPARQ